MLSKNRQDKILEVLKKQGRASFIELEKILKTSYATIRRDCEVLETMNLITRISKGR